MEDKGERRATPHLLRASAAGPGWGCWGAVGRESLIVNAFWKVVAQDMLSTEIKLFLWLRVGGPRGFCIICGG